MFELIEGPSTASGNIDLDKATPTLESIDIDSLNFDITDVISLGDKDISGKKLLIKLNYSDGSSIVYNGQMEIKVETSNPKVVFDQ